MKTHICEPGAHSTMCGHVLARRMSATEFLSTARRRVVLVSVNPTCLKCNGQGRRSGNRTNNNNNPWGRKGKPRNTGET